MGSERQIRSTGTASASKSGLYADPREGWLALHTEDVIDPARRIVDPHHHLWDRGGQRYMLEEMVADIATGQVEFANGVAAVSASGSYGNALICAGIVGHVNLLLGEGAKAVLEAEIAAGGGRFRGIRHPPPGMPTQCRRHVRHAAEGLAARCDLPQGFCLPRAARPEL